MSTGNRDEPSLRHDATDPPEHAVPNGRAGVLDDQPRLAGHVFCVFQFADDLRCISDILVPCV